MSTFLTYLNHLLQNHDGRQRVHCEGAATGQERNCGAWIEVMTVERWEAKLCVTPRGWATVRATGLNGGREAWTESQGTAKMMTPGDWEEDCGQHQTLKNTETQLCLTLQPPGLQPPGSSVHGLLQTRRLEGVAMLFSKGSSQPRDQTWVSFIADGFFTIWATRC